MNNITIEFWHNLRKEYFNKYVIIENEIKQFYFYLMLLSAEVQAMNNYLLNQGIDINEIDPILHIKQKDRFAEVKNKKIIKFLVWRMKIGYTSPYDNPIYYFYDMTWKQNWNISIIIKNIEKSKLIKFFYKENKNYTRRELKEYFNQFKKHRDLLAHTIENSVDDPQKLMQEIKEFDNQHENIRMNLINPSKMSNFKNELPQKLLDIMITKKIYLI